MLPCEMIILMAIAMNKHSGQELLTRPMDVTGEYIGYLYNSLVNRGYLKGRKTTGYQLTPIGKEAIVEFLKRNETKATDIAERLKLLGIDMGPAQEQKIGKLKKEAIKVK